MPLPNRVRPDGQILATPERGALMGNRGGQIHGPARTLTRRWASKAWIACVLDFKDRRRTVMGGGYTELFFLDEVTALAAGHRPCFECRRADALNFAKLAGGGTRMPAPEMDRCLHKQRLGPKPEAAPASLPDGAMVRSGDDFLAVRMGRLLRWSFGGYADAGPATGAALPVLTPELTLSALRAGYVPRWHVSASA
ncbi:hypothetical protein ACW9UR_14505 [Halovulum sp. GXIMD14794]